jgi:hypothetical protein
MLTKVLLQLLTFGLTSSFAPLQSHSHKEAMNDIRMGFSTITHQSISMLKQFMAYTIAQRDREK